MEQRTQPHDFIGVVLPTSNNNIDQSVVPKLSFSPRMRAYAASAALVIALAACGGSTNAQTEVTSGTDANPAETANFIPADRSTDGEPPEALAAVAAGNPSGSSADAPGDVSPVGIDSPPSPAHAEGNHAILADGKIYLRGTVPSPAISDLTVDAFERILGDGNVVAEYTIDPDVPFDSEASQAVFLKDNVLFETGSAVITPEFESILAFSPLLLEEQPEATLWVFGHTDSQGDDAANLELSQQRVEAVREWIVERGGDDARIFTSGEGESQPIADNATAEGRALNRRVEFTLDGFDINA